MPIIQSSRLEDYSPELWALTGSKGAAVLNMLRTVIGDDALSVLVPVMESIIGWNSARIREYFEAHGFALREWDKVQTDSLTICPLPAQPPACAAEA